MGTGMKFGAKTKLAVLALLCLTFLFGACAGSTPSGSGAFGGSPQESVSGSDTTVEESGGENETPADSSGGSSNESTEGGDSSDGDVETDVEFPDVTLP